MKPRLLLFVLSTIASVSAQPADAGRGLLLLSIDGMRPDYVLEADRHGRKIPNLRALVRDGVYATSVRGVLPTTTFILAGDGIPAGRNLGMIDMRRIAPTLAKLMGVPFPSADLPALDLSYANQ
jgi:hypothetical protein